MENKKQITEYLEGQEACRGDLKAGFDVAEICDYIYDFGYSAEYCAGYCDYFQNLRDDRLTLPQPQPNRQTS